MKKIITKNSFFRRKLLYYYYLHHAVLWYAQSLMVSDSLQPHGLQPIRLLCPRGKNTRVGCYVFFQGIFLNQGSNPGLLHCRQILFCLSHQESPSQMPQTTINCIIEGVKYENFTFCQFLEFLFSQLKIRYIKKALAKEITFLLSR